MRKLTIISLFFISIFTVVGCTTAKKREPHKSAQLPYNEWEFIFIYPKALPARTVHVFMFDKDTAQDNYITFYRLVDLGRPSDLSVGRWHDVLGGGGATLFNKSKVLPTKMVFCWDSVIDKKSYETRITFSKNTWQQMTTQYKDNYYNPPKPYYRNKMTIGLAPEGKVRVWLEDHGNPSVPQTDAVILTVSGDKINMCKGSGRPPGDYVYYGDTPEFIKGKTYPYGEW